MWPLTWKYPLKFARKFCNESGYGLWIWTPDFIGLGGGLRSPGALVLLCYLFVSILITHLLVILYTLHIFYVT